MNLKHIVSATLVMLSATSSLAAETFDESELPALKNYAFAACMYHIQAKIEPTPSITLNGLREEMDVFYQYSVLPTNFFETVYAQVELGTQNIPPSGSIRYCISWLQEDKVEGVVASLAK